MQNTTETQSEELKDIISVIREDHRPLKELIQIMKDSERPFDERLEAFQNFAPLLLTHAKAEEKALYEFMKSHKELREHAFEGEAEHSVADQLCEEIKRGTDEDQIGAKIKVVAESVEHHIREEENEILPDVDKAIDHNTLVRLTRDYIKVQTELIAAGQDDAPRESDLSERELSH